MELLNKDSLDIKIFNKNLEDIVPILKVKRKDRIVSFTEKHFKEFIHYVKIKNNLKKHGGNNKIDYMLTEETFTLIKNSYNLKNRYVTKIGNFNHINIIMSLENQTIGFIENSYKDTFKIKRQYSMNKYKVDLYFIKYKLVLECDENNHKDRNPDYEKEREDYILSLGNTIIRFDPNNKLFDLSLILSEVNKILFLKGKKESSLILINFN